MPENDPYDALFTPVARQPRSNYDDIINRHATANNLDPNLVRAVIGQESSGHPKAVSPKGARGLMQLMPATASRFGVRDVNDPEQNIAGGTKYLKFLHDRYKGDMDKTIAAYNAGEGNVDKYGGIPPFRETRNYVPAVKSRYQKLTGKPIANTQQDPYDALFAKPQTTTAAPQAPTSDPYEALFDAPPALPATGRGAGMVRAQANPTPRRGHATEGLLLKPGQKNDPNFQAKFGAGQSYQVPIELPGITPHTGGMSSVMPTVGRAVAATPESAAVPLNQGLNQLASEREVADFQKEADQVPFVGRLATQELNRLASKAERALAGVLEYSKYNVAANSPAQAAVRDKVVDYLKNRSQIAQMKGDYEPDDVRASLPKTAVKAVADAGMDLASLIATTTTTGIPFPIVMAGEAALNNSDKDPATIATETTKAYVLGKAYEYLPGKIAGKLGVTSQVGTRALGAGLFGAAGAGQAAYEGGDTKQVISQAIAQGALGALGGPERKGAREVVKGEAERAPLPFITDDARRLKAPIEITYENSAGEQVTKTITVEQRQQQLVKKQKVIDQLLDCLHAA